MPLYMDRHDVPGATRQDVAAAHMKDLELAGEHGVEFISYWFDESVGGVFCFARSPGLDNLRAVHEASHGLVPNEIIAVSEDQMLRFLGGIHDDPADASEVTSPVRTIGFTDLVDSTALLSAHGQDRFMGLLSAHDAIVRKALIRHRGREVKHTGDGIMAAFDEAGDALRWAADCLDEFQTYEGDPRLSVRIGLASGIPVDRNDDLYGETVVLASRLCDRAHPGCALLSESVHPAAVDLGLVLAGPRMEALKGFPDPVPAFLLGTPADGGTERRPSVWQRLTGWLSR